MLKPAVARCRRAEILLIGVFLAVSLRSSAQPVQVEDNDKLAKAHYEAGTRLFDVHDYDKALLEFKFISSRCRYRPTSKTCPSDSAFRLSACTEDNVIHDVTLRCVRSSARALRRGIPDTRGGGL